MQVRILLPLPWVRSVTVAQHPFKVSVQVRILGDPPENTTWRVRQEAKPQDFQSCIGGFDSPTRHHKQFYRPVWGGVTQVRFPLAKRMGDVVGGSNPPQPAIRVRGSKAKGKPRGSKSRAKRFDSFHPCHAELV